MCCAVHAVRVVHRAVECGVPRDGSREREHADVADVVKSLMSLKSAMSEVMMISRVIVMMSKVMSSGCVTPKGLVGGAPAGKIRRAFHLDATLGVERKRCEVIFAAVPQHEAQSLHSLFAH